MKINLNLFAAFLLFSGAVSAQNVGVNNDGTSPESGVMLDVKGSSAKASINLQNIFQIKSNDASTDALKLRLGLATNTTASLSYGVIEVPEFVGNSITAYRHLALQPSGGYVGVGISAPAATFHIASKAVANTHIAQLADAIVQGQEGRLQLIGEEQSWASACLALTDVVNATDNRHWTLMHRTSAAAPFTNPGNSLMFGYTTTSASGQDVIPAASTDYKMVITPAGNIGMGTANPAVNLEVYGTDMQTAINIVNSASTTFRNPRLNIYDYGSGGAGVLQFNTARGTAAAPTALLAGDHLGKIEFGGYNGSSFPDGAHIRAAATENWSATAAGTYMYFVTVPNGTTSLTERMRIDQDGEVGIGTTAPETRLHVANETTTTPRGIMSQQSSSDGNSAFLVLRKSRGTIAAPTAITNADNIGTIYSEAYDGSTFHRTGAFIKFSPTSGSTIAVGSIPTDIVFNTGSSGLGTEILRLLSTGKIQVPLASLPAYINNAAALAGGLSAGMLYRTGGDPDVICVVH